MRSLREGMVSRNVSAASVIFRRPYALLFLIVTSIMRQTLLHLDLCLNNSIRQKVLQSGNSKSRNCSYLILCNVNCKKIFHIRSVVEELLRAHSEAYYVSADEHLLLHL